MSRRLNATVHVRDDDGDDHMFTPEDEVPAWAADRIGDHAWDGPAEKPDEAEAPPAADDRPPAANAGEDKWRAYAIKRGVPEDEAKGLNKDQLKERVATLPPASPPAE